MPDDWEARAELSGRGQFDKDIWPEFFHMPVLMLMLITLLNDGTLIAIGYDNALPRDTPEKWNLPVLFIISSVLAAVALLSSLLILWWSLDSWNPGSVYQVFGLGGLSYGQVTTTIYLKVSVSDFLTLFSSRTGEQFFWSTRPSPILLGAGFIALATSTILAVLWPVSKPDGILSSGLALREPTRLFVYIWLYCIFWWFVQDFAKVGVYQLIIKYNLFGYNNTGKVVLPESTLKYIADNKDKDQLKAASGGHH